LLFRKKLQTVTRKFSNCALRINSQFYVCPGKVVALSAVDGGGVTSCTKQNISYCCIHNG